MDNRGTIISIYSIVLRSQITSHCCTSRFSCLWRPIHDVCNPWWRGPLCLHLFWSRPWLPYFSRPWQPIHDVTQSYNPWRRDSFVSVSTRVPAKHVHAGDKHASLATNMEYYDMCGADNPTGLRWWRQTHEFSDQYGILRYVRSRLPCEFFIDRY